MTEVAWFLDELGVWGVYLWGLWPAGIIAFWFIGTKLLVWFAESDRTDDATDFFGPIALCLLAAVAWPLYLPTSLGFRLRAVKEHAVYDAKRRLGE